MFLNSKHLIRTAAVAISAALCSSASATFHLMQIEQVIGGVNGDVTKQAIQLRMRTSMQNQVAQGRIRAWDAAGANPVVVIDMTTNVANGAAGSRVLICSNNFKTATTPVTVPDFTMTNLIPGSYLAAGSLTFENNTGTLVYWRLSWGGAAYTGPCTGTMDNDANGNFCPPWGTQLISQTKQALKFQGAASAMSTTNLADYAITAGDSLWIKNNGTNYTMNVPNVGACCLSNGACLDSQQEFDCGKSGGIWQGANTVCFSTVCSVTIGACCFLDGNCTDGLNSADCAAAGGNYQGDGTTCAGVVCDVPTGACCHSDGACTEVTSAECAKAGGTFQGNFSNCAKSNCPTFGKGACCFADATCTDGLTLDECQTAGGVYEGDNSTCLLIICPIVTGACCFKDGSCVDATSDQCIKSGGKYQGNFSNCGEAFCPLPPVCTGDLTLNGEVDVDDLLILINSWGDCEGCPADLTANGVVDVDDLLELINHWGPCPQ